MADTKKDFGAEFTDIINAGRKKKTYQDVANSVFGRRSSLPGAKKPPMTGPGASLASRMGVTKRSSSATPKPSIEGQWTHDLHHRNNPRTSRPSLLSRTQSASRVENSDRVYSSLQNAVSNGNRNEHINIIGSARAGFGQMSIKGKAASGPYVVIASNFAPGTTAADIEAAVLPIGGEMDDCYLISETPTVMCEILFKDKSGAENVISTFNNQKADGRLLYVYMKPGGPSPRIQKPADNSSSPVVLPVQPVSAPPRGPRDRNRDERDLMDIDDDRQQRDDRYDQRSRTNDIYQDGRYGFGGSDNRSYNGRGRRDFRGRGTGRGMYSDNLYSGGRDYRR